MLKLLDLLTLDPSPSAPTFEEVEAWLPQPTARPKRLLLLADIHANWHALASVLSDARGRYDTVWFLGDAVGYGPRPVECVRFVHSKQCVAPRRWRMGNHDLGVIGQLSRLHDGRRSSENATWTWKRHAQSLRVESPPLWRWFNRTGNSARVEAVKRKYGAFTQVFVHASLRDPVGYYLYPDDWANIHQNLRDLERLATGRSSGAWLVVGHTHMVCLARLRTGDKVAKLLPIDYGEPLPIRDGLYLINPGSVGQPRDGDRRAAYAILDTVRGEVEFCRVDYDVQSVQREMQKQGYPSELVERLWTARIRDTQHFDNAYERTGMGLTPRNSHGPYGPWEDGV